MNRLIKVLVIIILVFHSNLFSQSQYTEEQQNLLKNVISIWPYIGVEPVRPTKSYIPYDYIHESYKRDNPDKNLFSSRLLYELSTLEIHMNTIIGANLANGTFSMPNMYLSIGKSFHYDWFFSATPFITLASEFDVFTNGNSSGKIEVYDAGIETVVLTRILLSFRMKAVNDISEGTFMLLPSVTDYDNIPDSPHWYVPRLNNAMGFRAGIIGYYYELSYSQGFNETSSPLAILFKINGDYFKTHFLYQFDNSFAPYKFKTHNIIQLSAMGKIPFLDNQIFVNLLGEYTWRENDAHYIRTELGFEWNILNIGLRPLFYIPINPMNRHKEIFTLEYTVYTKFSFGEDNLDSIYFGFQGATDGRYYLALKALF